MQCPSCGWENIPGTTQCCVCSATLAAKAEKTAIRPPRAKDRSLRQRIIWSVSANPVIFRISERFYDRARHAASFKPTWGPAEIGLLLLSVIPGFTHTTLLRLPRLGALIFGATVAMTALACLLYKTPICDMLLWSVVFTSIHGVVTAIDHITGRDGRTPAQAVRRLGLTLMVLSVYMLLYTGIRVGASPWVRIAGIGQAPRWSNLSTGDRILIRNFGRASRGDTVLVMGPGGPVITSVIGLPGDTIYLSDRIYVNGRPFSDRLEFNQVDIAEQEPAQLTLEKNEYWIRGNFTGHPGEGDVLTEMIRAGHINKNDIWGRAIAVIGPPAHRRVLREDQGQ